MVVKGRGMPCLVLEGRREGAHVMTEQRLEASRGEGGFALILAILSLLVLTFLGLTLAATTSTELQIATNYRWGQQATYNAEAGIEVAKIYLRAIPSDWSSVMPVARLTTTSWAPDQVSPYVAPPVLPPAYVSTATRQWENSGCDVYGGHTGYGLVLTFQGAGTAPAGPAALENVTQVFGENLNGSFTVWIRRGLVQSPVDGTLTDDSDPSVAILTSEGVAPRAGIRNAARRVIELKVVGVSFDCQAQTAMGGSGQGGGGFASCRGFSSGCDASRQIDALRARSSDSASGYSTRPVGSLCDTGKD
jgi:hypothetical protein